MAEILPEIDTRPTLGLCLIAARLDTDTRLKLRHLLDAGVVDKIYVGLNGGEKASSQSLDISYYDPTRLEDGTFADFDGARNALQAQVKTDYWTWMDSDDAIEHAPRLRQVVEYMEREGVDMIYAPYEYAHDANGGVSELQNRERVIRTSVPGAWHGVIHETWIPETACRRETTTLVTWIHQKDPRGHFDSMKRNRKILEAEYAKEPRDPRIAYYLGLNYTQDKHFGEAIECFMELIQTGGWDEERYRAWLQVFSCYFELSQYEAAAQAALSATLELPEWPDAYFMLQQVYYSIDDHHKSLEWYKIGASKPEPLSDSAYNPTVRHTQPLYLAAFSSLSVGNAAEAVRFMRELERIDPDYPGLDKLRPFIAEAQHDTEAISAAKYLVKYAETYQADPKAILDALPVRIKSDVRLTEERRKYILGVKWPKGSVVFYCGSSFEPWGPDTLEKGMGGSEEAVVYLSRELARQGREVVVYNNRTEQHTDNAGGKVGDIFVAPEYLPWTEINPNDEYDVFVAWRSPEGIDNIKARRKLVDLHDIIDADLVYRYARYVDKYLFKTNWHRSLYPELPDSKCAVIGNGLVREQFS